MKTKYMLMMITGIIAVISFGMLLMGISYFTLQINPYLMLGIDGTLLFGASLLIMDIMQSVRDEK